MITEIMTRNSSSKSMHKKYAGGSPREAFSISRPDDALDPQYFTTRAWHCLQRLRVKTWGEFKQLKQDDVLGTQNAGIRTWNEISALQCHITLDNSAEGTEAGQDLHGLDDLQSPLNRSDDNYCHRHQPERSVKIHENEQLEMWRFSVRTRHCLEALGACTEDKLKQLTRQQVLLVPNAGNKTWLEISSFQARISDSFSEEPALDYSSFDSLTKSYLHAILKNERHERVIWARWNVDGSTRAPTLDALGHEFGLTRERVRQIIEKGEQKLSRCWSTINPLWRRILDFTGPQCLISSLSDLSDYLSKCFRWQERPDVHLLNRVVALRTDFRVAEASSGRCTQVKNQKRVVSSLAQEIIQIARDNASQQDAADLWSIDFEDLRELLGKQCYSLLAETGLRSFPEYLVDLVLSQVRRSALREGSSIYSANLWSLRFGNQLDLVETILLREARVMHFREVHEQSLLWRPTRESSERNIHACLDRSHNAILWGRGAFIHRDHISIPYKTIHRAETWLLQHLGQQVPLYSAHGLYQRFANEFSKTGIPSEIALYSCLRISAHPELFYPRYPYILLTGNVRLPVTLLLEEYIQQAERTVSLKELRAFACETMGIDEVQFNLKLPDIPNVVRVNHASYLHTDCLDIDLTAFGELCKYLRDLLCRHRHVSVVRVFDDRQVTCRRLAIVSPEMLYSLLEAFARDDFDFSHYPQVLLRSASESSKALGGITQAVLDFLKQQGRPCTYAELEEHFVLQRRYRPQTIYAIAQNDDVLTYAHGCVVHQEVLGLSRDLTQDIEHLVCTSFAHKESRGECYVLADDILESYDLPLLNHGISWTPTLLADFISRSGHFRVLGSSRKVIVPINNKRGIRTFEDLVSVIVTEEYAGTVQLQTLEEQLRLRHIIRKRLTEKMIGNNGKVRIVDSDVVVGGTVQC